MDPDNRPASPKDPARPLHRPPSPPPAGVDNQGYTQDSADPNHNDSFTSKANGHAEKVPEAVNLELINLKPQNGQNGQNGNGKSKKDVEVDMNASNPYDEYFVPVNEHRKYMRWALTLYYMIDDFGAESTLYFLRTKHFKESINPREAYLLTPIKAFLLQAEKLKLVHIASN